MVCPTPKEAYKCPPGEYCPGAAYRTDGIDVPAGTYSTVGLAKPLPCPAGHYCNGGTGSKPAVCPTGFFCPAGAEVPTLCGPGFDCRHKTGLSAPIKCKGGKKACPFGNDKH
jgi:hypothetical protein